MDTGSQSEHGTLDSILKTISDAAVKSSTTFSHVIDKFESPTSASADFAYPWFEGYNQGIDPDIYTTHC